MTMKMSNISVQEAFNRMFNGEVVYTLNLNGSDYFKYKICDNNLFVNTVGELFITEHANINLIFEKKFYIKREMMGEQSFELTIKEENIQQSLYDYFVGVEKLSLYSDSIFYITLSYCNVENVNLKRAIELMEEGKLVSVNGCEYKIKNGTIVNNVYENICETRLCYAYSSKWMYKTNSIVEFNKELKGLKEYYPFVHDCGNKVKITIEEIA